MSIELLNSIKKEARNLSVLEKAQLADYLLREAKNAESDDPELTGKIDEEIQALRMQWLKENREEYAGQYVALDGNKLVGTGKTIREANEQALQNGVQKAFLVRVSGKDEILSGSW